MSQDSTTPSSSGPSPDPTPANPPAPPTAAPPVSSAPAAPAAAPPVAPGSASHTVQSLQLGDGPSEQWPSTLLIRFGQANMVGQFRNARGLYPRCGTKVIVQTDRGMEIGEIISVACQNCGRAVPGDKIARYVQASGPENCIANAGKVLRPAGKIDVDEAAHITRSSIEMKHYCQQKAAELHLEMRVIGVEHVFGGERAIFYFESENRIDFRDLVKDLAHQYQTRIEMRQVGARDEARLLADFEICGRECCCRNFLKNLKPVNMRMAKTQKATLDPTKVSGRCGRLRCCLRYESENYDRMEKSMPALNSRVRTEQGVGKVIDRQIITQMVVLLMEPEFTRVAVPVEAILERNVKTPPVELPVRPQNDRPGAPPRRPRRDPDAKPRKLYDDSAPPAGPAGLPGPPASPAGPDAPAAGPVARPMEPADQPDDAMDGGPDEPAGDAPGGPGGEQEQQGQSGPGGQGGPGSPPGQGRRRRRRRRGRGGGGGNRGGGPSGPMPGGPQGSPGQGGPPPTA